MWLGVLLNRNKRVREGASDFHAFGSLVLSTLSLCSVVPELYVQLFTIPYMAIDGCLELADRKWFYVVHHFGTLVGMAHVASSTYLMNARANSIVLVIELSTLALNHWNRKRASAVRFWVLVVLFFLNRVLYLGYAAYSSSSPFLAATATAADLSDLDRASSTWALWCLRLLHAILCVAFVKIIQKAPKYGFAPCRALNPTLLSSNIILPAILLSMCS